MNNLLPATASEAFEVFTQQSDDAPDDCHNHCDHYYGEEGHCCDCNEDRPLPPPIPAKDFIEAQAETHPVRYIAGLMYDLDVM